ncbi:MAG: glycosyltransferase [Caldimicrobium sp.]|nr:glycosyltransferase [Caldimicrobium sp.]MCX7613399.1 glycosyltransferase [Caldimicrobium sp.]MDW8182379.1 glycosyltransferase [Caldimicrobium sp.]
MKNFVSVIIPTYNRAYILSKAIESVVKQTYRSLELIVVDDGSKDETPRIITKYPVRYVKLPRNFGPSFARNRGILKSKAKFLAFLDSDDHFLPYKIEKQLRFLDKNPWCKLVQTEEIWFKGNRRLNPKKHHAKAKGYFLHRAVKLCVVSISTVLMDREVFNKVGYFDETFPLCEDYEFWLRVALHYPMGLIEEALVIKDGGRDDQLSQTPGLDFYRIKALLKVYKSYQSLLKPEEKLLLLGEASRKTEIFLRGAKKHGNLKAIFQLIKIWKEINEILTLPYPL